MRTLALALSVTTLACAQSRSAPTDPAAGEGSANEGTAGEGSANEASAGEGSASEASADKASAGPAGSPAAGDSPSGVLQQLPCMDGDSVEFGSAVTGDEGVVSAALIDASPWPAERFENDWTVQLMRPGGAPFPEASIVSARSYDPTHGIAGLSEPSVIPQAEPGSYRIEGLHFLLRSAWEVQIEVDSPDGDDFIVLPVCVIR